MKLTLLFLFASASLVCGAQTESKVETPFHLFLPEGWFQETFTFPIPFAPEIEYDGVADIRFAPGFVTEEAEDFWTYCFVWWIGADARFEPESLEDTMVTYFEGLTRSNEERNNFEAEGERFEAKFYRVDSEKENDPDFVGLVVIFEPLVTKKNIVLNMKITTKHCSDKNQAVFFELSPQPYSHELWTKLEGIRKEFKCKKE